MEINNVGKALIEAINKTFHVQIPITAETTKLASEVLT